VGQSVTTSRWRLYADRSIEAAIVEHLRDSRVDVVSLGHAARLSPGQRLRSPYRRARELKRYLLTRDEGFWDDQRYPLKTCAGVIILATKGAWVGKWLVLVLRKMTRDYGAFLISAPPEHIKVRVTAESISVKIADGGTEHATTRTCTWTDLFTQRVPGHPLIHFRPCGPDS
jgi:hypothetical protein